jgi:hypothetical protein
MPSERPPMPSETIAHAVRDDRLCRQPSARRAPAAVKASRTPCRPGGSRAAGLWMCRAVSADGGSGGGHAGGFRFRFTPRHVCITLHVHVVWW